MKYIYFINLIFTLILASDGLSEEGVAIQELAINFAKNEMLPHMAEWDEKVKFY